MSGLMVPALVVALVSLWSLLTPFMDAGSREERAGRRSYDLGEWTEAAEHYARARGERESPALDYNVGAAAYRGESYELAADGFGAAALSDRLPPGQALYNLGNARYRAGDLEGALEAYRAALGQDPDDAEARYNFELVTRQLESGENQPQPGEGEDGGEEGEEQQQEQQQSSPDSTGSRSEPEQDQPQDPEEQESAESQPQQGENVEEQPEGEGEQMEAQRLLTPEQAQQLLDQITPEERELIEARLKAARRRKAEKDW